MLELVDRLAKRVGLFAWMAVLSMAFVGSVSASERVTDAAPAQAQDRSSPVSIPGLELDARFARIRSWRELDEYLKTPSGKASRFASLSDSGAREFIDSLVFTDLGLASFDGGVLARELGASQIYEILGLFGLQRLAPIVASESRVESDLDRAVLTLEPSGVSEKVDIGQAACPLLQNYHCAPPATCRYASQAYCITCNCGMVP